MPDDSRALGRRAPPGRRAPNGRAHKARVRDGHMPDVGAGTEPALTEAERERIRRRVMTTRKIDLWSLIWRESPWQESDADGLEAAFEMADSDYGN